VPDDPKDNEILKAALTAGVDYLITNDPHLLAFYPYEAIRIISMTEYHDFLVGEGLIQ
jgi:predicted nucleic acid-binding protein